MEERPFLFLGCSVLGYVGRTLLPADPERSRKRDVRRPENPAGRTLFAPGRNRFRRRTKSLRDGSGPGLAGPLRTYAAAAGFATARRMARHHRQSRTLHAR